MTAAIDADFKTEPYLHQLREFEMSSYIPARALLWQMRTGKSKVIIDTACHLFKQRVIDAVIVIAPNGVHENWTTRELKKHHWDTVERNAIAWNTKIAGDKANPELRDEWRDRFTSILRDKKRLAWFSFASATMTRDEVRKLLRRILHNRTVMIIFDEVHDFRTPGSKRTKMARGLAPHCDVRRSLSGTSLTNSPLHAFSQFELLERKALGFDRYKEFKDTYAIYEERKNRRGRLYKKLLGYQNLEDLRDRLAPWSSVVLREDCDDMPDLDKFQRLIDPTPEQLKAYRDLHDDFIIWLSEQDIVQINEFSAKWMKLQQVMSGFIVDEFNVVHDIPGRNPRLDVLSDEVYMAPGSTVIWCQFREDLDRVSARLMADGQEVLEYHGRTSDKDRAKVRELMAPENDDGIKYNLVAQPQAGGQGLDFSGASTIIWYSHTFDAIVRTQADERATQVGGKNIGVLDLVMPGTDPEMLERVSEKFETADYVAGRQLQDILERARL